MPHMGITSATQTHKNNISATLGFHYCCIKVPCIKLMKMCGQLQLRAKYLEL